MPQNDNQLMQILVFFNSRYEFYEVKKKINSKIFKIKINQKIFLKYCKSIIKTIISIYKRIIIDNKRKITVYDFATDKTLQSRIQRTTG